MIRRPPRSTRTDTLFPYTTLFRVMNELRNRGVEDIMLAVVDGLKGFPDAITAVFPEAMVQTCIVHLLRNSMDFVAWKDRKTLGTTSEERRVGKECVSKCKSRWSRIL